MKSLITAVIALYSMNALASDVGSATKELCASKGMVFVKQSKNGRRQHCRKKPTVNKTPQQSVLN